MFDFPSTARRRFDERSRAMASSLAEGVTTGVMIRWLDIVGSTYVEAALAGGASFVAVKLIGDAIAARRGAATSVARYPAAVATPVPVAAPVAPPTREESRRKLFDRMRDRRQDEQFLLRDCLEATGPIASRDAGYWLVYASSDAEPRVLDEREYARLRRTTRDLVEIEETWEGIRVQRLYLGRLDSSLTGKPSVEIHAPDYQGILRTEWHVEGTAADEPAAMEAHDALMAGMTPSLTP